MHFLSSSRKRGSSNFNDLWIPAFAGMTFFNSPLIDTLCEIVCHTDIKSSISLTGENIDEVPFHDKGLDPCLRRDDKVSAQRIPIQPVEIESLLDLLFYKFATYLRKNLNFCDDRLKMA